MRFKTCISGGVLLCFLVAAPAAFGEPFKPARDAAAMLAVPTETFTSVAMAAGTFEIESSKLAKQKDVPTDVMALADMIVMDHTKANEKLASLSKKTDNSPASASLSPKHKKMLEQLANASGADFVKLYLDIQLHAHMEAVGLFATYAGSGDNQIIVGFAKETLPRLETHLGHVKKLIGSMS